MVIRVLFVEAPGVAIEAYCRLQCGVLETSEGHLVDWQFEIEFALSSTREVQSVLEVQRLAVLALEAVEAQTSAALSLDSSRPLQASWPAVEELLSQGLHPVVQSAEGCQ
jgi:hypothetical protein